MPVSLSCRVGFGFGVRLIMSTLSIIMGFGGCLICLCHYRVVLGSVSE